MKETKPASYNETKVKKPSFFVYWLPSVVLRPLIYIFFRHRIKHGLKGVKGPILAIANHCSTMDIVFSVQSLLPKRFNIVASKDLFTWEPLKPFITRFGAIPKNQCSIDLQSLKLMKKAIESGNNVLIYPEGRTSVDGKQLYYIAPSIAKFIKMMDTTVALIKTEGAFLTKPRWYRGFRFGKVVTETSVLLTKEEVKTLPVDEIYKRVKEGLQFNDNLWQREHNVRFHAKHMARNLNYILYKCPKCGAEYEMESDDKFLTCTSCGNKVEYTPLGELKPVGDSVTLDRIDLWFDFCRNAAREEVMKDNFYISKPVRFWMEDVGSRHFHLRGEGELYMNKDVIGYKGTKDGESFEIKQYLKLLPTLITKNEEGIDLVECDTIYRFLFTEHKWSSKYGLLCEQLFAVNNGLVK